MRIAAIQLSSQSDLQENLRRAELQVMAAAQAGAKLLLLPEGFAYLGEEEGKRALAESFPGPGPIAGALSRWARTAGVTLVAGGVPETSGEPLRPYNTAVVYGADGQLMTRYRKLHLFEVALSDGTALSESRASSPGEQIVSFELGPLRVGLAICYDLRFPELFAELTSLGCQLLLLPAAFTKTTGEAHWQVLLRARAIETQSWLCAAAQFGVHPRGRRTFGHSMIVSPWGEVCALLPEGEGFVCWDCELDQVEQVRAQMPLAAHRRLRGPRQIV